MATSAIPYTAPLTERYRDPSGKEIDTGRISRAWSSWFLEQQSTLETSGQRIGTPVSIPPSSAAIGVTPIPLPGLNGGLYQVSIFAKIAQSATVSSSLTVRVAFTCDGIPCELVGPALTDNTTATVQSLVWVIRIDPGSPISYSTDLVSVGVQVASYTLSITVAKAS